MKAHVGMSQRVCGTPLKSLLNVKSNRPESYDTLSSIITAMIRTCSRVSEVGLQLNRLCAWCAHLHVFRSSVDNVEQIRFGTSVHRNCVMAANVTQSCINSGVAYKTFQIHSRASTEALIKPTSCVHQVRLSCSLEPLSLELSGIIYAIYTSSRWQMHSNNSSTSADTLELCCFLKQKSPHTCFIFHVFICFVHMKEERESDCRTKLFAPWKYPS